MHDGCESKNRAMFNEGLSQLGDYHVEIYNLFDRMWKES